MVALGQVQMIWLSASYYKISTTHSISTIATSYFTVKNVYKIYTGCQIKIIVKYTNVMLLYYMLVIFMGKYIMFSYKLN